MDKSALQSFLDKNLEERKALKAAGKFRLPTADERRAMQYLMYRASGSMGSLNTPLAQQEV